MKNYEKLTKNAAPIMKNNFHLKKMKIILKKLPDSINRMTEIVYGWIIRLDMITKA